MALAQTKVSGTVVYQEDNEPVIGASVLVVGTNIGTVTDSNGQFSLTVPAGKSQLRFTYVGMEPLEISARPNMRIVLRSGDTNLDEIVVTAMGLTRQKKSVGYAIQELSADDLNKVGTSSIGSALQGKLTGVDIRTSSGTTLVPLPRSRSVVPVHSTATTLLCMWWTVCLSLLTRTSLPEIQ